MYSIHKLTDDLQLAQGLSINAAQTADVCRQLTVGVPLPVQTEIERLPDYSFSH